MPFSKEKTRKIYIAALVLSFLLIVGSIYLHLRQKTHLGRMSFNLDRDRIKPTSGVESTTWMNDYDSKYIKKTDERLNSEDNSDEESDMLEASSPEDDSDDDDDNTKYTNSKQFKTDNGINKNSSENEDNSNKENDKNNNEDDIIDEIISHDFDGDDIIEDPDFDYDLNRNSEYEMRSLEQNSSSCLRCLCMTVNECRPTFCGSGNPCGLYRISKLYWIDGGKPTIAGGSTENEDQDYLTCVNDDTCSATVIQQYYNRYKRDCNKDGVFDCKDQIALHLLGPSGCITNNLSNIHANRLKNCFIESNLNYLSYSSEEEYDEYRK